MMELDGDKNDDVLRKDHEELIMKSLSKVNDISESINEKDKEFSYMTKKLNNYATLVDEELNNVNGPVYRAIVKTQSYFKHREYQKELKSIVERVTITIQNFNDNRQDLLQTLNLLESKHNEKNNPDELDLQKIDLITQEINDLEYNKNLQELYLKSVIEAMTTIERYCNFEEKVLKNSLKIAEQYYSYKEELMNGLIAHQDGIKAIEGEIQHLKIDYQKAMSDLNDLSIKIKHDNEADKLVRQMSDAGSSTTSTTISKPLNDSMLNNNFLPGSTELRQIHNKLTAMNQDSFPFDDSMQSDLVQNNQTSNFALNGAESHSEDSK